MLYFSALICCFEGLGPRGAAQSRFKGLCVFITWLQLPQVLQGKESSSLVMIMARLFLKTSLFSFFRPPPSFSPSLFLFFLFWGQAEMMCNISGNILCVSSASHERVYGISDHSTLPFIIFTHRLRTQFSFNGFCSHL